MPSLSSTLTFFGFAGLVAANCNPSYNVTGYGDCTKQCKMNAGRDLFADWTDDPASPHFVESLKYKCEKGVPAYTTFMTVSGTCLMGCSDTEQQDYAREHADSCLWYDDHKSDVCAEDGASSSASQSGSVTSDGGAKETSSGSGPNDPNGDAGADSQEDESTATKLQLGVLVGAAVAVGSALLL